MLKAVPENATFNAPEYHDSAAAYSDRIDRTSGSKYSARLGAPAIPYHTKRKTTPASYSTCTSIVFSWAQQYVYCNSGYSTTSKAILVWAQPVRARYTSILPWTHQIACCYTRRRSKRAPGILPGSRAHNKYAHCKAPVGTALRLPLPFHRKSNTFTATPP